MMRQPRIIPTPSRPSKAAWASNVGGWVATRYEDGSYEIRDADGKSRGRYRDADKLATYFAAWMQERDARETKP